MPLTARRVRPRVEIGMIRLLCLISTLGVSGAASANPAPLVPTVDTRIELISIIGRLARLTEFADAPPSNYSKAIDASFAKHASHPLVVRIKDLNDRALKEGGGFGSWEMFSLAVHLGPPPELSPLVPVGSANDDTWEDRTLFESETTALVRRFYEDAQCDRFFQSQEGTYGSVARSFERQAIKIDRTWLDGFFAVPATESYSQLVSVLGVGDATYLRVNDRKDHRNTHTIVAYRPEDASGPMTKARREAIARSALHEYVHAFTNRLVDQRMGDLEAPAGRLLADPVVAERVKGTFYDNAPFLLYESLVRASTIKYLLENAGVETGREQEIAAQERAGFLWMRGLVALLDAYQGDRARYPSLSAFMPEIVRYLETVSEAAERKRKGRDESALRPSSRPSPFQGGIYVAP